MAFLLLLAFAGLRACSGLTTFSIDAIGVGVPRSRSALDAATAPDTVALVTGASRGIGKGIALELAADESSERTVIYVVGRSSRTTGSSSERELDEECTVERTVEEIEAISDGRAVGIPIIMSLEGSPENDKAVYDLIDRIKQDHGRLDVIVASAYMTPPNMDVGSFRDDYWKQGAAMWDAIHDVGLRGQFILSCAATPLMIETAKDKNSKRPCQFFVSSFGGKSYTFNVAYGVGKAATDRLAFDASFQLKKYGIDTISIYPGVVRTEGNIAMKQRGKWEEASGGIDLDQGESPRFAGRAVTALRNTNGLQESMSGKVVVVAELARKIGFTDVDGRQPPSIRSLQYLLPNFVFPQVEKDAGKPVPDWMKNNIPDILLPWSVFAGGPPPTND